VAAFVVIGDDEDPNEEIGMEKVVMEVLDPITGIRIKDPVKGLNCEHTQMLDKSTYKGKDNCPMCQQPVIRLQRDASCVWFKEKLQYALDTDKVVYYATGKTEIVHQAVSDDDSD